MLTDYSLAVLLICIKCPVDIYMYGCGVFVLTVNVHCYTCKVFTPSSSLPLV